MRDPIDIPPVTDPEAKLERALLEEFLAQHGHSREDLNLLPAVERAALMAGASTYAAGRLAEINARSHYVRELKHED
jgi:hypothetical protein